MAEKRKAKVSVNVTGIVVDGRPTTGQSDTGDGEWEEWDCIQGVPISSTNGQPATLSDFWGKFSVDEIVEVTRSPFEYSITFTRGEKTKKLSIQLYDETHRHSSNHIVEL